MKVNMCWLKYFSPFVGILFCPLTILLLWTTMSEPFFKVEKDIVEEIIP